MERKNGSPQGKRGRGQPTKLTPELTQKIAEYIEKWLPFEQACILSGVNERYLYRWQGYGERDAKEGKKTIFTDFCQALKSAQSKAELAALDDIRGKASNWQASAWLLERRHFNRYGRRVVNEMVGKDGGAIRIEEQRRDIVAQTQGSEAIRKQFRTAYDLAQRHLEKVNGSGNRPN